MSWRAACGATLMIKSAANNIEHIHFVLNDPADFAGYEKQSCLLVSATTIRAPKFDATCVLEPGCHPFIHDPSYIAYSLSLIRTAAFLEQKVAEGVFREHEPATPDLSKRILACMDASPRTSGEFRQLALQAWKLLKP
jgi:hypothetical protein